jgi:hypothetical protein
MKNRFILLTMLFFSFSSMAQNLISNGDFSDGLTSWTTYTNDGGGVSATFAATNNEAHVTNIAGAGGDVWWIQLNQVLTPSQISELTIGNEYTVTFDARSNVAGRQLRMYFGEDGGGFNAINTTDYVLTTSMANYDAVFTVGATYTNMKFGFEMGLSNDDVIIDNVTLTETGVGGPVGPPQPAGFVVEQNVGPNPVGSGEVFLACGPNNAGGNIIYRLFYAPTASIPADPTTATEYPFGSTAGDGGGVGPFGFVLTGLDPGVNYTFWLYQYNTADMLFSMPTSVEQTAGGQGGGGGGSDFMVTFRVDMSEYAGTFTTMELNGDFNDWCGNCAQMTNTSGDIWEITVELPEGPIEYKFSYDNWANITGEVLIEGMPCTVSAFGFTNRSYNVTSDATLPLVCYQSCQACGEGPATRNVTFRLNMAEYTGTYTTPEVNGTFNNWCGNCAPMMNTSGDIWELTIPLMDGNYEYKFSFDNWANVTGEVLTEGSPCTVSADGFTNRTLTVSADATLPIVCWASCADCETGSIAQNELDAVSIFPNPSNGTVYVQGTIEAGNYEVTVFDLNGRSVYSTQGYSADEINLDLNLTSLESGLYSIQLTTDQASRTEKLLIGK